MPLIFRHCQMLKCQSLLNIFNNSVRPLDKYVICQRSHIWRTSKTGIWTQIYLVTKIFPLFENSLFFPHVTYHLAREEILQMQSPGRMSNSVMCVKTSLKEFKLKGQFFILEDSLIQCEIVMLGTLLLNNVLMIPVNILKY